MTNIAYSSSNIYYPFCKTSIYTLLENNKDLEDPRIFVLSNGISFENKDDLQELCKGYKVQLVFLDCEKKITEIEAALNAKGGKLNFNPSSFLRLFLAELIPDDVDKVLFIDSDTYINSGIKGLYELDISQYPCAMTYDQPIWPDLLNEIGLSSLDGYYNAGVMLINLAKWRKENILSSLLAYYYENGGNFLTDDQSIINAVLHGRIMYFEYKYNAMQWNFYWSYKKFCSTNTNVGKRTREEYYECIYNPVIVHFAGPSIRPWERWCAHPYTKKYRKALKKMNPHYRIAKPRSRTYLRAAMNYWKHILVDNLEKTINK